MKKLLFIKLLASIVLYAILTAAILLLGNSLPATHTPTPAQNGAYIESHTVGLIIREWDKDHFEESALDFLYPWEVIPALKYWYGDKLPGSIQVMYQGEILYRFVSNDSGTYIMVP